MRVLTLAFFLAAGGTAFAQDEPVHLPDTICLTNACAGPGRSLPPARFSDLQTAMASGNISAVQRMGRPKDVFETLVGRYGGMAQMQSATLERMRNANLSFHTIAGVVVVAEYRKDGSVARYVAPPRPANVEQWQVGQIMDLGDTPW